MLRPRSTFKRFMLCNDSVTVATEVPVYMDDMDIEHMQEALKFKIPLHVVYKLRDRQKKEDPRQMKFESLIDTDVEKNK